MRQRKDTCRDRLAYLLKKTRLTQKELAEKAGIRESSLSNYMQGRSNPNMDIICKLSEALDVSTDWLLGYGEMKQGQVEQWENMLLDRYNKLDFHTKDIIHDILGIYPVNDDWLLFSRVNHGFTEKEVMDAIETAKGLPTDFVTKEEGNLIFYIKTILKTGNKQAAVGMFQAYIQTKGPISKRATEKIKKLLEDYDAGPDE